MLMILVAKNNEQLHRRESVLRRFFGFVRALRFSRRFPKTICITKKK